MATTSHQQAGPACSCSGPRAAHAARTHRPVEEPAPAARLEELIPIAVVIAAGCEPCARRMVERALAQGSSAGPIRKTLGIIAHLRREECLLRAVGPEVVARMDRPLAMARKTLASHAG